MHKGKKGGWKGSQMDEESTNSGRTDWIMFEIKAKYTNPISLLRLIFSDITASLTKQTTLIIKLFLEKALFPLFTRGLNGKMWL